MKINHNSTTGGETTVQIWDSSRPSVLTLEALISKLKFPFTAPYVSYKSSSEKLLKYQLIVSCVIMPLILINNLFYKALISLGEF